MFEPEPGSAPSIEDSPAADVAHGLTVIVLAAGEGTRMRSAVPKVLHGFAGRSMISHVLAAVAPLGARTTAVVVGHGREQVSEHLKEAHPDVVAVVQERQLGTAHAVKTALDALGTSGADGTVLVLPGDAPLLRPETLATLLDRHRTTAAAAMMLTSRVPDPTGYGRVVRGRSGGVEHIVEQGDADADEQAIDEVSALVYAFDGERLADGLKRVGSDNAQGEFYLPDVVGLLRADGHDVQALLAPAAETAGVNDRVQLADAARIYRDRLVEAHQRAGVTVLDPASVWIDADVRLDADVTVGPAVQLHGTTTVGAGATVGPDCTLTDTEVGAASRLERTVAVGARVGHRVTVGPFAYLRPGTVLADDVHVGTYVEMKNADVGAASKVPHLTYVGDASIGTGTNIGAASVFVNYDGVAKHRSRVGDHARTGADTMFVAPVTVGDGAYTAAGSVITEDVPPGALAVSRAPQRNVEGWVARKRPDTPAARAAAAAGAAAGAATGTGTGTAPGTGFDSTTDDAGTEAGPADDTATSTDQEST